MSPISDEQLKADYWAAQAQFGPFEKGPEEFVQDYRNGEKIATFMEPRPSEGGWLPGSTEQTAGGFWKRGSHSPIWHADINSLDQCRLVQERLDDDQWYTYLRKFGVRDDAFWNLRACLHATVEQKIKALAEVLPDGR